MPLLRSTKDHFSPQENPAPPRPRRPEAMTSSRSCSGPLSVLPSGRVFGGSASAFFKHLVAAVPQIAVEVRRVARLIDVLQNQAVFLRHISSLTLSAEISRFVAAPACPMV